MLSLPFGRRLTLHRAPAPQPAPPTALGATDAELARLTVPAIDIDRARLVALALLYGGRA